MVPPPTALTQNAAICARKRHHAHQQPQPQLTVTPQLAYAVSSSVCCDLPIAVVHAWDQNADDMMACNGVGGGGELHAALMRGALPLRLKLCQQQQAAEARWAAAADETKGEVSPGRESL